MFTSNLIFGGVFVTDQDNLRTVIAGLVSGQLLAVLATQNAGQPYTSLLSFANSDDLAAFFFATNRKTSKFKNIEKDGRVALLIDNRSNRAEDLATASALTVIGTVGEMTGKDRDEAAGRLLARHPSLAAFLKDPATAVLSIAVSRCILVGRFQEVAVLDMEDQP